MGTLTEVFGERISVYTRADAIADGQLVDVTEWASEVGFTAPVVFTRHLWSVVDVDSKKGYRGYQDTRGRAHDVLWMTMCTLRATAKCGHDMTGPHIVSLILTHGRQKYAKLWAILDGDGVTIMFPEDH